MRESLTPVLESPTDPTLLSAGSGTEHLPPEIQEMAAGLQRILPKVEASQNSEKTQPTMKEAFAVLDKVKQQREAWRRPVQGLQDTSTAQPEGKTPAKSVVDAAPKPTTTLDVDAAAAALAAVLDKEPAFSPQTALMKVLQEPSLNGAALGEQLKAVQKAWEQRTLPKVEAVKPAPTETIQPVVLPEIKLSQQKSISDQAPPPSAAAVSATSEQAALDAALGELGMTSGTQALPEIPVVPPAVETSAAPAITTQEAPTVVAVPPVSEMSPEAPAEQPTTVTSPEEKKPWWQKTFFKW